MVSIKLIVNNENGRQMKKISLTVASLLIISICSAAYSQEVYVVESGDQLWNIASKYAPKGVTVHQEIVAIYEANPGAFQYANMNSLRTNVEIKIPESETVLAVSEKDATDTLSKHHTEWKQGIRQNQSEINISSNSTEPLSKQLKQINTEIASVKKEIQAVLNDITVSRNVLEQNM
jgi:pilus assembly protein FimV